MKKLLSLVLALAMLLGCAAFAESVDYTGTWVLTGAEAEGIQMGPSMLALAGLEMKFALNADGVAVMSAMGSEETGSWAVTETGVAITDASNVTMNAVYQNEMLLIEEAGSVLMLTREGAAPAVAEAAGPAAQANVAPENFEGQWLFTRVSMMGMEFAAEDMGMYMAFVLADGKGIMGINESEDGSIITNDIVYTLEEVEGMGTALTIAPVAEDAEEDVLMLFMAEDGALFVEEDGSYMIFEKQTEEAAE